MSTYAKLLKSVIDGVPPATGMTRSEMEAEIASITEQLKRPIGDAMRIILCGDRAALRKALAAMSI